MAKVTTVRAVVLRASLYGEPGDVVTLPEAEAAAAREQGVADPHPDAVAHADARVKAPDAAPLAPGE